MVHMRVLYPCKPSICCTVNTLARVTLNSHMQSEQTSCVTLAPSTKTKGSPVLVGHVDDC